MIRRANFMIKLSSIRALNKSKTLMNLRLSLNLLSKKIKRSSEIEASKFLTPTKCRRRITKMTNIEISIPFKQLTYFHPWCIRKEKILNQVNSEKE